MCSRVNAGNAVRSAGRGVGGKDPVESSAESVHNDDGGEVGVIANISSGLDLAFLQGGPDERETAAQRFEGDGGGSEAPSDGNAVVSEDTGVDIAD